MSSEFEEIKELRRQFMRAAYELRDPQMGTVYRTEIMRRLGLDPDNPNDDNQYTSIARHFDQRGFITRWADGYNIVQVTALGESYVEGDLQQPTPTTNVAFHVQNAYNSIFGTQEHAEQVNISFDLPTIEAELQRAVEEIERRGGPDTEELKEMVAEVEGLLRRGEVLEKGRFARFQELMQRNGWIASPVAGALLGWALS
jgi:hypothetical protein